MHIILGVTTEPPYANTDKKGMGIIQNLPIYEFWNHIELKSMLSKSTSSNMSSIDEEGAAAAAALVVGCAALSLIPQPPRVVRGAVAAIVLLLLLLSPVFSEVTMTSKPAEAKDFVPTEEEEEVVEEETFFGAWLVAVVSLFFLLDFNIFSTTVSKMDTFLSSFFLSFLFSR